MFIAKKDMNVNITQDGHRNYFFSLVDYFIDNWSLLTFMLQAVDPLTDVHLLLFIL
jgi:hypothetical protein